MTIKLPKDPRGGHIRLYWKMLRSPAWKALENSDIIVYINMRMRLKKTNNGNIQATLKESKECGIRSSSTLAKSLRHLEQAGFIEKTRQGGIAHGGKTCSLYGFTDEPIYELPMLGVKANCATNEWEKFKSLDEALAAIGRTTKNRKGIRKTNLTASIYEMNR